MDPELLRETEELLQAQKLMIRRCESQIANRDECIRNLMQLAHLHGAERRAAWDAYIADMEISDVDGRPTADLRRQPAYRLPEVLR